MEFENKYLKYKNNEKQKLKEQWMFEMSKILNINKCNNCKKILDKNKFNEKWNISTPIEKLNMYGIIKLKKLAKIKNLKGYSRYNKNELIEKLKLLVNDNDFPIK
jgi:hypothetical protein